MNSKTDDSKSKNKARVETTQEFSTKDIQRSEDEYRKDLDELMTKLGHTEKYKKNTIKKLAKDLEQAYVSTGRDNELSKISARIKQDIRAASNKQGLDGQIISDDYIEMILQEFEKETGKRYKGKQGRKKQRGETGKAKNSGFSAQEASSTTSNTSTQSQESPDASPGPTDTDEPKRSPASIKQELDFDKWVNSFYHFAGNLIELLTAFDEGKISRLDDNMKLVSETRGYRFKIVKGLAELDLRTIYGEIRKNMVLLNDFQNQIDDEVESRKRKQELTSK